MSGIITQPKGKSSGILDGTVPAAEAAGASQVFYRRKLSNYRKFRVSAKKAASDYKKIIALNALFVIISTAVDNL